jgi:hypothetical protein
VLLGVWGCGYDVKHFSGDGVVSVVSDTYPRYKITLRPFELSAAGMSEWRFRGTPSTDFFLVLAIPEAADAENIRRTSTMLRVSLTTDDGASICDFESRVSGWRLMSASDERALWHEGCRKVRLSSAKGYILRIGISDASDRLGRVTVVPEFRGGGVEIP